MDRDELIDKLRKLPKGTQVGFTTNISMNTLLWQPFERVAVYPVDKNNHLNRHGKKKVATIR